MLSHTWDTRNDWTYCTHYNTKCINNVVTLDNSTTGTILSDIRDSSSRIYDYAEIVPKINVPTGSSALFYVRSGWYPEYHADAWTDWKLINEPEQRMEYTLSLTKDTIIADYNIKSISNIYYIKDYNFQTLATNLKTIYAATLTDEEVANNPLYSSLWSARVDDAIVDFAKVDYDGDAPTIYATDASFIDNVIYLTNPLPDDNVIVIIKYVPRYYIYSNMSNKYFQFKIDLEVEPLLWHTVTNDEYLTSEGYPINLGQVGPTIYSVSANYILDIQHEMESAFPKFFRRL